MKKNFKTLLVLLSIFLSFFSCSENNKVEEVEKEVRINVELATDLSSRAENAYNTVVWSETDCPALVQLDAEGGYVFKLPVESNCQTSKSAVFSYLFDSTEGDFRYWLCKSGFACEKLQTAKLESWPIEIPAVQKPLLEGVDPRSDVLISDISFDLSQKYMSENVWLPSLERHNAIAAISLTGIPTGHQLKKVVLKTSEFIVGTHHYNVREKYMTEQSDCSSTLTAEIEGKLSKESNDDGSRTIYLSMWPSALEVYTLSAFTVDEEGKEHEFVNKYDLTTSSIVLKRQCVTRWKVGMRSISDKPVLPATPEGPEKVVEGGEGPTLDLFNKMKAYKENGITSVDEWRTHYLGYQGVMIHESQMTQYGTPIHMWVLEADPQLISFSVGTPLNENVAPARILERVSHQAERAVDAGKKVIAAINGDAWGASGGLYTYGVIFKDGLCLKNTVVYANPIANADTFYATEEGQVGIVDEAGFKKVLENEVVENALGGWYRLISQGGEPYAQAGAKDGDPLLRDKEKTSGSLRNFLERHPRTFMGITDDRVYLMVVDGRQQGWSAGLTMNGCARICYSIGCKRAINFDGGGSSVMVKRQGRGFTVLNHPSDGSEREVVNSLLVVAR